MKEKDERKREEECGLSLSNHTQEAWLLQNIKEFPRTNLVSLVDFIVFLWLS